MKDKYENERIEQLFRAAMLEVAKIESEKLEQEALKPAFLPSKKFNRKIERMIGIKAEKRNWKLSFHKLYAGYNRFAGWVVIAAFLIYLFFPHAVQNMLSVRLIENNPGYAQLVLSQTNYPYDLQFIGITQIPVQNEAVTVYNTNLEVAFASDSYQLSYLPEGFSLVRIENNYPVSTFRFQDTSGKILALEIYDSVDLIDFEQEMKANSIEYVNDKVAVFSLNDGESNLIWTEGNRTFIVNANLPKDEVLKVAQGIKNN